MLEQQKKVVLKAYQKLMDEGRLSANLLQPTTANLKKECCVIFQQRSNEAIRKNLQSLTEKDKQLVEATDILAIDSDKFKPLQKYIKDEIKNPSIHTVELLAWLIDYKKDNNFPPPKQKKTRWFEQKYFQIGAVVTLALVIGYLLWNKDQCMYWDGERYIAVSCGTEDIEGARVIALNRKRLKKFQKTNRTDTIHYKDIGRIWYMGADSVPDFFTDSGMHPIDDRKQLKPITKYIIDKYILKTDTIVKSTP